jgi:hypothetical protein
MKLFTIPGFWFVVTLVTQITSITMFCIDIYKTLTDATHWVGIPASRLGISRSFGGIQCGDALHLSSEQPLNVKRYESDFGRSPYSISLLGTFRR